MADQIKSMGTRAAEQPAPKAAEPAPKAAEPAPKKEEKAPKEVEELTEEELAARAAREAYLRMWPLEAEETR